ncbi:hypothetical protein QEZ48_14860 [Aquamicrobium lusatiense]|uniref:hypothetical protein n=1 Tax=Aquamicrobium lusatiense TaxID=89772 RepID=UPI002458916A|nr:hypothetical protein [Aquamicrobium lusatiense]MDH4992098.1 hypothetical protein [Aquamicrobium lusatiense]
MAIDALLHLFGRRYDDPEVVQALAALPPHKAERPSDGAQYIVSKDGGFDLLFEDSETRGAGNRQNRTLTAIFLFNEGVDGHSRFDGAIPLGFAFEDRRAGLIAKSLPERTWVIGEGRVDVNHFAPDHDSWIMGDLSLSADYGRDGSSIRYFTIQIPSDEPEWTPEPQNETWKSVALLADRKMDAIKLYREENGGGLADAKAAIERFAAQKSQDA